MARRRSDERPLISRLFADVLHLEGIEARIEKLPLAAERCPELSPGMLRTADYRKLTDVAADPARPSLRYEIGELLTYGFELGPCDQLCDDGEPAPPSRICGDDSELPSFVSTVRVGSKIWMLVKTIEKSHRQRAAPRQPTSLLCAP